MRIFNWMLWCLCGCLPWAVHAQKGMEFPSASLVTPYQLAVTHNKTTTLVFINAITTVDRGSADILVQKAGENMLRVKAGVKGFEETSLTVTTGDGKLYSFLVNYSSNPAYLNVRVEEAGSPFSSMTKGAAPVFLQQDLASIKWYTRKALATTKKAFALQDRHAKMVFRVAGFYVKKDLMFCHLQLENHSAIGYAVQSFRFYTREGKSLKKKAVQEIEIPGLHTDGHPLFVRGGETGAWMVALPKFTVPKGKGLFVEVL